MKMFTTISKWSPTDQHLSLVHPLNCPLIGSLRKSIVALVTELTRCSSSVQLIDLCISFVTRGFCCLAVVYYMCTAIFMNKWVNEDVSKVVDPTYWRYKGHYFLCLRFSFSFSITILDLCCSGEELLFAFILRKKIGLTFQSCLSFCAVLLWARNQKEVPVP